MINEQADAISKPELPERRTGMDVVNIRLKNIEDSLIEIKEYIKPLSVIDNRVSVLEHKIDAFENSPSHLSIMGEHTAVMSNLKERIELNEKAIETTNRRLDCAEKGIYTTIDEMKEKGFSRTWAILMSLFTMLVGGFIGYLFSTVK